ncbi:MAG: hypothetical protein M3O62_09355 [Pseudomonadota bacterium]|nr:hypothetical protein [Pseudomonadota bacterium]
MILRTDSKYPMQRAYVLKLTRDATPDALSGRIENLVSGKHEDFTSASELLQLLACDLALVDAEVPLDPEV